jgi:hypothetical protein
MPTVWARCQFSVANKPVLTSSVHHDHHAARFHLDTLGSYGLFYHDARSLLEHLLRFNRENSSRRDWNAYRRFAPAPVMQTFKRVFLDVPSTPREHRRLADAPTPAAEMVPLPTPANSAEPMPAAAPATTAVASAPQPAAKKERTPKEKELLANLSRIDRELASTVRLPVSVGSPPPCRALPCVARARAVGAAPVW